MKFENTDYLYFVRSQPCLKCFKVPSEAHHENYWLEYGSQRMNDYVAVPLCSKHHRERHDIGAKNFWNNDAKFVFTLLLLHLEYLQNSGVLTGRSMSYVLDVIDKLHEFQERLENCEDKSSDEVYNKYSERCIRDVVLELTEYTDKVVKGDDNER